MKPTPGATPAPSSQGLTLAEHEAIRAIDCAPHVRPKCPPSLSRLFQWTAPTEVLHVVPVGLDCQVLVVGEPENGAYEWAVTSCTDGRISQRSDDGYGSPEVALRDGLIAVLGLPSAHAMLAAAVKARAVLSDPIASRDPVVYGDALRALDTAISQATGANHG